MNKKAVAQESVWDYPRPPRLEPTPRRVRVLGVGQTIADSTSAMRILETSHPPVYYIPAEQVNMCLLRRSPSLSTFCEFKGNAIYWTLDICLLDRQITIPDVAWSFPAPSPAYARIAGHMAFYASRLAEHDFDCWVDDERVIPQAGDFYGGWITSNLRGPFKGEPGSHHW